MKLLISQCLNSEANLIAVSIKQTTSVQTSAKWLPKKRIHASLPLCLSSTREKTRARFLSCRGGFLATAPSFLSSVLVSYHTPRVGGCIFFTLLRDIMILLEEKSRKKTQFSEYFEVSKIKKNLLTFIACACLSYLTVIRLNRYAMI